MPACLNQAFNPVKHLFKSLCHNILVCYGYSKRKPPGGTCQKNIIDVHSLQMHNSELTPRLKAQAYPSLSSLAELER
jgi:hypothetical protein